MRSALVIGLAAALLLAVMPGTAAATAQECARLTKQIQHYQNMAERAEALGNDMWQEGMEAHVDRLRERSAGVCHDFDDSGEQAAQAFATLLKLAAKAAVTYFTFGAF